MDADNFTYYDGDIKLVGYLALPQQTTPTATILIAPAWAGRDEFACAKARALAELGYVGFAIDMYGDAKIGSSVQENSALMTPFMQDRALLRQRITAAFEAVKAHDRVDENKLGAIGFCFGGLCVLDLARSGADVKGVVSFHGLFTPLQTISNEAITAKVLALHGYDDPMATPDIMLAFADEMTQAGVDWQIHAYGHTQHAFTNPEANDQTLGTVYNALAEQRSRQAMQNFFAELFGGYI